MWFRRRRDQDLDDEIRAHLSMAARDRVERGESPEDARLAARAELGNEVLIKEVTRETWGWASLDRLTQDIRSAVRMLRKTPGFTITVVLTLALGIGGNTAIYSVLHAALLPLAIQAPDRVVMVWTENVERNWHNFPASNPDFEEWKASGVFQSAGGFDDGGVNLRIGNRTDRIDAVNVTDGVLDSLGVPCQIGRWFRREDMLPGRNRVVILSDRLWRAQFGADPGIVGRAVTIDGAPHLVIGVLPKGFPRFEKEQLYKPLVFTAKQLTGRGERFFGVLARLRDGVSFEMAQQRMSALAQRQAREHPQEDAGDTVRLQLVRDALVEDARTLLVLLSAAVGLLLLIGCANIANLLLARGTSRTRELAIRTALGAGRWRLCRQLLTENVVLGIVGGFAAVLPALWSIRVVASFQLDELPNSDRITLNPQVLAFNFCVAVATGLVFGIIPAWQVRRADVNSTLKSASRSYAGCAPRRLRSAFVVTEVAFTVILLASAGLMARSFLRLRSDNPGYEAANVLTARTALSDGKYVTPESQATFFDAVLRRVRQLPGVSVAGAIDDLPTSDNIHGAGLFFPGRPDPRSEDVPVVIVDSVSSGYFRAMHIPLLRGRYLTEQDRDAAPPVAVIDRFAARRYWPGQDAVGQQIKLGRSAKPLQVVGVVGDVTQNVLVRLVKGQMGQIYVPFLQQPKPAMTFTIRTGSDPAAFAPALRDVMRGVDGDQPVFAVQTMEQARASGRRTQQLATALLGGFSVIALLLATLGIYGVIAYSVGQRMREFGIRIALGAQASGLLRLVLRQGVLLAGIGAAIGLAGALALGRLMSSLLYGISATDPLTFAGVTVLLTAAALLASYFPARRAMRLDPIQTLRDE
ncbi:MAG TPA: ABC transporter permease [Bryobacteraceae bacterium]|nr:ABC transporter permease [Bryobacteraceae bacterium]